MELELGQLINLIKESKKLSKTYRDSSEKLFDIYIQYERALRQTKESRTTLIQDENNLHKTVYSFDVNEIGELVKTKLAYIEDLSEINEISSILDRDIQGLKNVVENYERSANEYELASSYYMWKNLQLERDYKVKAFGSPAGKIFDRVTSMQNTFALVTLENAVKRLGLLLSDIFSEDKDREKIEPTISEHKTKLKHGDLISIVIDLISDKSNNINIKNQTKDIMKKIKPKLAAMNIDVNEKTSNSIRTYIQKLKGDKLK